MNLRGLTREEKSALAVLKSALARAESQGGKTATPAWINAIQLQTVLDALARFVRKVKKLFGGRTHFVKAENG